MTDRNVIEWLDNFLDDYYDELYLTEPLTPDIANVCITALQEREERSKGRGVLRTEWETPLSCPQCMCHLAEDWVACPQCGKPLKGADNG